MRSATVSTVRRCANSTRRKSVTIATGNNWTMQRSTCCFQTISVRT
nr:MAG TPA: hypothetical protein [Caudoviricetes sp.]